MLLDWPLDAQPQEGADVDWGNPLSSGLIGFINAASLPVGPSSDVITAGDPYVRVRPRERGAAHISDTISRIAVRAARPVRSQGTVAYVGTLRSTGSSDFGFAAAVGTGPGSDVLFGFQQGNSSTRPRGFIRNLTGGSQTTAEIVDTVNGTDIPTVHAWALRYDGTTALRIYRDGVDVTGGNALTAATGAGQSLLNNVGIGLSRGTSPFPPHAGVGEPAQQCYLVMAWDRALSDEEIARWSQNPWQLFRTAARIVVPASSSGGAETGTATGTLTLGVSSTAESRATANATGALVLGASSTAQARATADTTGALALGVVSTAQARATADATGLVALGVTSTAQATATATATGTLQLGVTSVGSSTNSGSMVGTLALGLASVAEARATATAAARFVLGLVASGTQVVAGLGPGLVRAALTWVARVRGDLTHRTRHDGALTHQPRHDADLTHVARHAADLTYKTRD